MLFEGSAVAIVTPFNEDETVDYDTYSKLIDFQLENETDAIVVCGTTGEAATMTEEERLKLIEFTAKKVNGKIPVIAGTGSNCTRTSVDFSKKVSQIEGVDGLLLVTPYYNKATKEGLYLHFKTIADAVDLPIILYNVPGRTRVNIPVETVKRLAEIDNIVGIKDATADLHYTAALKGVLPDDFAVYSGNDDVALPLLSLGGNGVISVLANILPKQTHQMCQSFIDGDIKGAAKIQEDLLPLIEALFVEVNPVPVKAAMSMMGMCENVLRLPLTKASEQTSKLIRQRLEELNLLGAAND
ncbi:MAG: 4-hydroxy-tetrahydrodipicolinate synthase [Finegoldia sp.]|nr:4-hydroxy-tetrahydrodipicolinate synthase [Finegoldia sp.]